MLCSHRVTPIHCLDIEQWIKTHYFPNEGYHVVIHTPEGRAFMEKFAPESEKPTVQHSGARRMAAQAAHDPVDSDISAGPGHVQVSQCCLFNNFRRLTMLQVPWVGRSR